MSQLWIGPNLNLPRAAPYEDSRRSVFGTTAVAADNYVEHSATTIVSQLRIVDAGHCGKARVNLANIFERAECEFAPEQDIGGSDKFCIIRSDAYGPNHNPLHAHEKLRQHWPLCIGPGAGARLDMEHSIRSIDEKLRWEAGLY